MNIYQCHECHKSFSNKKSLGCHIRWHKFEENIDTKFQLLCSCIECKQEISVQNIKAHVKSKHTIKTYCRQCNTPLYDNKKFCNRSCSATHNNKNRKPQSKSTQKKISESLKKYHLNNKILYTPVSQCVICLKFFSGRGKTCSDTCKKILLSRQVKKAFSEGRHEGNGYRNRKNNSFLERSFIEYLNRYYPETNYEFNKPIKIYNEDKKYDRCYYIDFYLPNQKIGIELDGSQHQYTIEYDRKRDKTIFDQEGIKIIRVTYKEYFDKTRKDEIDKILQSE